MGRLSVCDLGPDGVRLFPPRYQYAESDLLQDKTSHRVWLQYDLSIGAHAAHAF